MDVLVIDQIGKDISGTGFDCNTVGRYHNPNACGGPDIKRLAILDITDASKRATATESAWRTPFPGGRLANSHPSRPTPNALTATATLSVKLPMVLASDRLNF